MFLVGFLNYKNQRIHNIFDEIYYEEDDYRSVEQLFRKRAFSKIKDIKFYDNRMFVTDTDYNLFIYEEE